MLVMLVMVCMLHLPASTSEADTGWRAAAVCFCSPEVPELQQMSDELARSKDLSGFVRRLRAALVSSLS